MANKSMKGAAFTEERIVEFCSKFCSETDLGSSIENRLAHALRAFLTQVPQTALTDKQPEFIKKKAEERFGATDDKADSLIGRMVKVTKAGTYYNVGDYGRIIRFDGQHYYVDFNDPRNPEIHLDGRWFVELLGPEDERDVVLVDE
jgi:hypothetical protein